MEFIKLRDTYREKRRKKERERGKDRGGEYVLSEFAR